SSNRIDALVGILDSAVKDRLHLLDGQRELFHVSSSIIDDLNSVQNIEKANNPNRSRSKTASSSKTPAKASRGEQLAHCPASLPSTTANSLKTTRKNVQASTERHRNAAHQAANLPSSKGQHGSLGQARNTQQRLDQPHERRRQSRHHRCQSFQHRQQPPTQRLGDPRQRRADPLSNVRQGGNNHLKERREVLRQVASQGQDRPQPVTHRLPHGLQLLKRCTQRIEEIRQAL